MPDEVVVVSGVPHTCAGKWFEVALQGLFQGIPPEKAPNVGAADDADVVQHYAQLAQERGPR